MKWLFLDYSHVHDLNSCFSASLDSLVPQLEFVPKIARSSLCALLKFVYEMSINDKLVMHIDLF